MSIKFEPYAFRMFLFDYGDPKEFLLFVRNFNMTLATTGTQYMDAKIHYLRTLVRREALRKFDLFSSNMEKRTPP